MGLADALARLPVRSTAPTKAVTKAGGPNPFFAAYDEETLGKLWEIHLLHFGDTSAMPHELRESGSPMGGLHEIISRAVEND